MTFKGNEESIAMHLRHFHEMAVRDLAVGSETSLYDLSMAYVINEVSMEDGMAEYGKWLDEVRRRTNRLLRAIKSVRGRTFHKRLIEYLKEAYPSDYIPMEIVREPEGNHQKVTEYGRLITDEWVQQWATGTEGDSFDGIICIPIKTGRYLKFRFSI